MIACIIGVSVLIVSVRERLRRRKLKKKFQLMQRLIDPGSTIWPGPQIRGSYRGRELDSYRRNELIGFTQRGGTNGKTIVEFRCCLRSGLRRSHSRCFRSWRSCCT